MSHTGTLLRRMGLAGLTTALLTGSLWMGAAWLGPARAEQPAESADAALARTRKTVRMLDDVYKTAVVLITDKYVQDENDFPAGSAAIALFGAIKKKGWHDVRLVDVSGQPYNDENSPKDGFEKQAAAKLKAGADYFEQIVEKDGVRYLRAATPIPVVSKKCIMCHANYADAKPGAPIGTLSYTLKIE